MKRDSSRTPSKRSRLTPFYPPRIKPVRVGDYHATTRPHVYEGTDVAWPIFFWNGKEWWNRTHQRPCMVQERHWRGLAEKP